MSRGDAIGPTAHYTGYVWARNGLSHPELATLEGRLLYESLRPAMTVAAALGATTLEQYLLARHHAIDARLTDAIERERFTQVIEVASGLSARGWRLRQRYGDRIRYIEADLPAMAERKRRALVRMGALSDHHPVRALDALSESGPQSLSALAAELDAGQGTAIITEGLLSYLPTDAVIAMWRRFARVLHGFEHGRYISDLHLGSAQNHQVRAFRVLLSAFVRGRVYLHFDDASEAVAALRLTEFDEAEVDRSASLVHILEASTTHRADQEPGGRVGKRAPKPARKQDKP